MIETTRPSASAPLTPATVGFDLEQHRGTDTAERHRKRNAGTSTKRRDPAQIRAEKARDRVKGRSRRSCSTAPGRHESCQRATPSNIQQKCSRAMRRRCVRSELGWLRSNANTAQMNVLVRGPPASLQAHDVHRRTRAGARAPRHSPGDVRVAAVRLDDVVRGVAEDLRPLASGVSVRVGCGTDVVSRRSPELHRRRDERRRQPDSVHSRGCTRSHSLRQRAGVRWSGTSVGLPRILARPCRAVDEEACS